MRIQHNIMAMNAYRNYNNNTSALAKNLEKLSSGYRINRAGDDAAGLAISEKMRAQITALGTAQKNVKDGISLVKTAEGATQEIHDMLNRMVDLATQSANGTYQDDVDREAIEDEFNALKTEINRIADASNFNGIKLLDGSMDAGGETTKVSGQFVVKNGGTTAKGESIDLPKVGTTLGTDTVLHKGATDAVTTNEFSVELHNVEFSNDAAKKIEISIGGAKFTYENGGTAGDKMDAAAIAKSLVDGDAKWAVSGDAANFAAGSVKINGVEYKVELGENKTSLKFSTTADLPDGVTIPKTVSVKDPDAVAQPATAAKLEVAMTYKDNGTAYTPNNNAVLHITGTDLDVTYKFSGGAWAADGATQDVPAGYTINFDGTKLTLTADDTGAKGANPVGTLTYTLTDAAAGGPATAEGTVTWTDGADAGTPDSNVTGDYNASTTDIQTKAAAGDKRLASTVITLTDDMVTEGSSLTIGKSTYTFTTDKSKKAEDGYVVYDKNDSLTKIAAKLTDVAAGNSTYTVGHEGTNQIRITEVDGQTNFTNLDTVEGIEASLGFTKAVTSEVKEGQGLTLQIGEDSESYNQLKVSIKDMHIDALGLDDETLSTQAGAQKAVKAIKDAINSVSSTRGKLGATQNRLEHTANNLSTMKENIQDAEATIRDTDIAEEMMAYTKNNILVQSAQAMLAQANQIPQGVLQLLG